MPSSRPVRLQKLLADAGVASRRAAERLIAEGHVSVNGAVVRELGTSALPGRDEIRVDGVPLRAPAARTHLLLHKPAGFVTSVRDPHAERTVMSLLPRNGPRLYPVGRLDRDSEGLLLLTDDGDLTERLLHPRHGIEREYAVLVRGDVGPNAIEQMRRGTVVEGARVVPVSVAVSLPPPPTKGPNLPGTRWLRIVVAEGRKREVRVMCAAVHMHVLRLIRVRFGPLELGDLPPGRTRPLTSAEVEALNTAAGQVAPRPSRSTTGTPVSRPPDRPATAAGRRRATPPQPARNAAPGPPRARATRTERAPQRASSKGKRPSNRSRSNS